MQTPGPIRNSTLQATHSTRPTAEKTIVLVGASVRAAAESARKAGFSPIAIDLFGDRETLAVAQQWVHLDDLRANHSEQAFREITQDSQRIAIVGGLQGGYDWIGRCDKTFLGANPKLFAQCDEPGFLESLASAAKVHFPATHQQGVAPAGWLIKQRASSGGLGVSLCHNRRLLPENAYAQRRLSGRVHGASFLGSGNHAIPLGVCRLLKKRLADLPYAFAGAVGPVPISSRVQEQLRRLGNAFVAQTSLQGPFNIDLIIDHHDDVWLLEVNPRWSGSMEIVESAWSARTQSPCSIFDSPNQWQQRAETISDAILNSCDAHHTFIKRILYSRNARTISPADFAPSTANQAWIWKDVPSQPTQLGANQPIATLLASLHQLPLHQAFRIRI